MNKVVLVTGTLTNDPHNDHRFQLARMMCQTAATFGYFVIVVDASPNPQAKKLLEDTGAAVYKAEGSGMGSNRRQVFRLGLEHGADDIVWLEPEKIGMIPELEKCLRMIHQGHDLVIPWRSRLFTDYPHYQAISEARANHEMAEMTNRVLDLMCGPRIMTRSTTELFLSYEGRSRIDPSVTYNDMWGILFVPVLWAIYDGLKVGSCPVDYIHPAIQTRAETGNATMDEKRNIQRKELVDAMRQENALLITNMH